MCTAIFSALVVIFSTYIVLIYAANFTRGALNGWLISSAIAIAQDILSLILLLSFLL